jgi:hypothetical protein
MNIVSTRTINKVENSDFFEDLEEAEECFGDKFSFERIMVCSECPIVSDCEYETNQNEGNGLN